jgi:hypothetical protein
LRPARNEDFLGRRFLGSSSDKSVLAYTPAKMGAPEVKNIGVTYFCIEIAMRELIDRHGVRSTAALPKLTIFCSYFHMATLVHLYRA